MKLHCQHLSRDTNRNAKISVVSAILFETMMLKVNCQKRVWRLLWCQKQWHRPIPQGSLSTMWLSSWWYSSGVFLGWKPTQMLLLCLSVHEEGMRFPAEPDHGARLHPMEFGTGNVHVMSPLIWCFVTIKKTQGQRAEARHGNARLGIWAV